MTRVCKSAEESKRREHLGQRPGHTYEGSRCKCDSATGKIAAEELLDCLDAERRLQGLGDLGNLLTWLVTTYK